MRRLIKQREIVADDWRYPAETAGPGERRLLPLKEFLAAAGAAPAAGVGVWLVPEDDVQPLAPYVARLALVVAHFPKNGEGRGFSQAQVLRQRLGYTGELRAAGNIKRDYLYLLARCGFDSFDLDPAENLEASLAYFNVYRTAYQPASDRGLQLQRRA